jgi:hypothetical protein
MLGEKVAYNDGAGWDGLFYRSTTFDFASKIFAHGYDSYRIQRILPFAVVNVFFKLTGLGITNASSMMAVQALNLIALLVGIIYFFKIVSDLKLSLPIGVIGFAAMFFNYPVLKLMGYYPYLTDTYALVFAIMQFYFFIKKRKIKLIAISILGAFVWPTLFMSGLVLALLPDTSFSIKDKLDKKNQTIITIVKIALALAIPVLFLALLVLKPRLLPLLYSGDKYQNYYILSLSLFCVSVYIYCLMLPLKISIIDNIKRLIGKINIWHLIIMVVLYAGIEALVIYLSNGQASVTLKMMLIGRIIIPPTVDLFVFIVCNFMYYGVIIFLMIVSWKGLLETYAEYGYSFFIIIVLGLLMSLNSESRHLLSFIPFLVFPLLKYLSDKKDNKLNLVFSIVFVAASLALSRFWYKINVPGIEKAFIDPYEKRIGSYQDFPAQRYFMAQGPWMSHQMYYLFGGIFLVFLACFCVYYFYPDTKLNKKLFIFGGKNDRTDK